MAIRFIYFDLGRVLLDFTHERGFAQIARLVGMEPEQVRRALVDTGLSDRYESGEVSTAEFHQAFCDLTDTSATLEALAMAWGDIFEIKPETVALAGNLKAAGHSLGILSNTCEAHWEHARKKFRTLSLLFDHTITSYEVKSMKPESAIYDRAARQAGRAPDELFFVDDREENVAAARRLGWHARRFTSALQLAADLESLGIAFNR